MFDNISDELIYILRILIAAILGFSVGFERKMRLKEAGIKTHSIVSIGACLMMLISKYGFTDIGGGDGSRIAAQVVSGIGFLGAGMIIYKREALRGLTTAAGVWTTAGIGMCIGAGMYLLSIGATIIVIFAQSLLHHQFKMFLQRTYQMINITFISTKENIEKVKALFGSSKFLKSKTSKEGDNIVVNVLIRSYSYSDDETICKIMNENPFIFSIERSIDE